MLDRDDDDDWPTPNLSTRPVREYLSSLYPDQKPAKRISLTDPQARWTAAPGGPAFFAYSTNYLVDVEAGIVVDVEATPAYRPDEVNSAKTMVNRVEARFDLKPSHLIGDTAYGTAEMLGWLVEEKDIEPHVPVWDKTEGKQDRFGISEFIWDAEADKYHCPGGQSLERNRRKFKKPRSGINKDNTSIYSARKRDCVACPYRSQCCPQLQPRRIRRSIHEDARNVARRLRTTDRYRQSRKDRKKVEMPFGHLKRILKLDRLQLHGISGAHDSCRSYGPIALRTPVSTKPCCCFGIACRNQPR